MIGSYWKVCLYITVMFWSLYFQKCGIYWNKLECLVIYMSLLDFQREKKKSYPFWSLSFSSLSCAGYTQLGIWLTHACKKWDWVIWSQPKDTISLMGMVLTCIFCIYSTFPMNTDLDQKNKFPMTRGNHVKSFRGH